MIDIYLLVLVLNAYIQSVCSMAVLNAALGMPATQSSTLIYNSEHMAADKAVDGDSTPSDACASTDYLDADPWWQVDLGRTCHVTSVFVTNRLNYGNRLHDFNVTVSNNAHGAGILCGHYKGAVPSDSTVELKCEQVTRGRYVRISKPSDDPDDNLALCEVVVIDSSRAMYKRAIGEKPAFKSYATITTDFSSCIRSCKDAEFCRAFVYKKETAKCELFDIAVPTTGTGDGFFFVPVDDGIPEMER